MSNPLYYEIGDCYLGKVLVMAASQGVLTVAFASTDAEDRDGLTEQEELECYAQQMANWSKPGPAYLKEFLELLDGKSPTIPTFMVGSAFQHKVWDELMKVPRGQVITYKELACRIGQPGATQAVAGACGTNPLAVVVPCHRVMGKKGIGGYHWGVERKRALLNREGIVV